MKNGALIFAQNNKLIDYTKLAVFAGNRVKQFLDIPVSIVTDNVKWLEEVYPTHPFDTIIEIPYYDEYYHREIHTHKEIHDGELWSSKMEWKNISRTQVYNLSPYDKTLVIDSDYIISSSVLKTAFNIDADLQIYSDSFDLADWRSTSEFHRVNPYSVKFYWATTFVFQKNLITESFFNLIDYIKLNWFYFRTLYSIQSPLFRNDFAFSIAIHIMNGKTNGEFASDLPGRMYYSLDKDFLVSTNNEKLKFLLSKKDYPGEYTLAKTSGLDIHIMNKQSLIRMIDGGLGV
jgi:hypothetical protein